MTFGTAKGKGIESTLISTSLQLPLATPLVGAINQIANPPSMPDMVWGHETPVYESMRPFIPVVLKVSYNGQPSTLVP